MTSERFAAVCAAAAVLAVIALCGCAAGGAADGSSAQKSIESAESREQGTAVTEGGLRFCVPDGFAERAQSVGRAFSPAEPGQDGEIRGAAVRLTRLETKEGFDLENWVLNWSAASVWKVEVAYVELGGTKWLTGVCEERGEYYYYAEYGGTVFEAVIGADGDRSFDGDVERARAAFESTVRLGEAK